MRKGPAPRGPAAGWKAKALGQSAIEMGGRVPAKEPSLLGTATHIYSIAILKRVFRLPIYADRNLVITLDYEPKGGVAREDERTAEAEMRADRLKENIIGVGMENGPSCR